jgi:hypothetical protein
VEEKEIQQQGILPKLDLMDKKIEIAFKGVFDIDIILSSPTR